jgi:predicted ATP-dependent endonuclease of OLD family
MEYLEFEIQNFKGIKEAKLYLGDNVITPIVGLNESGKTTVLEAIDFLRNSVAESKSFDSLYFVHIVPAGFQSNFNRSVKVSCDLRISEEERREINKFLAEDKVELNSSVVRVAKAVSYKNTIAYNIEKEWFLEVSAPNMQGYKLRVSRAQDGKKLATYLDSRLPEVVYFPDFAFDYPDPIYLKTNEDSEGDRSAFFSQMIQDVLDSIGSDLRVQTHIVERAMSSGQAERMLLKTVLSDIGSRVSGVIADQWSGVLSQALPKIDISFECNRDAKGVFVKVQIRENEQSFDLIQKSLGFRWFFSFVLLTYFRGFRNSEPSGVLFLFDEPASNLHSTAQARLLEVFRKFEGGSRIMYTTHSHHMLDPNWLAKTVVVANEIAPDGVWQTGSAKTQASISIHQYRALVGRSRNQTTFFQPILDLLQYAPSKLELQGPAVLLEGKSDFSAVQLMIRKYAPELQESLRLVPGGGASSMQPLLSLFIGWGWRFLLLLDDDDEGRKQKAKYIQNFGKVIEPAIVTLGDICPEWDHFSIEDIVIREFSFLAEFRDQKIKSSAKDAVALRLQDFAITGEEFEIYGDNCATLVKRLAEMLAD